MNFNVEMEVCDTRNFLRHSPSHTHTHTAVQHVSQAADLRLAVAVPVGGDPDSRVCASRCALGELCWPLGALVARADGSEIDGLLGSDVSRWLLDASRVRDGRMCVCRSSWYDGKGNEQVGI